MQLRATMITIDGSIGEGGGRCVVNVTPTPRLSRVDLVERGDIQHRSCTAILADLPQDIGQREINLVQRRMGWPAECFAIRQLPAGSGPGNVLSIEIQSRHVTEVCTGFGERGVRAETVAGHALREARQYLAADVPVGIHLADQLLLPMALAGGGSFVTMPLSRHAATNIEIIQAFLDIPITTRQIAGQRWMLNVGGT